MNRTGWEFRNLPHFKGWIYLKYIHVARVGIYPKPIAAVRITHIKPITS